MFQMLIISKDNKQATIHYIDGSKFSFYHDEGNIWKLLDIALDIPEEDNEVTEIDIEPERHAI